MSQVTLPSEVWRSMGGLVPFVNWAGGKSQLIRDMAPYFPRKNDYNRYIEPFVGGGVVFLTLQPDVAILGDSNEELINCYKVIRDDVDTLIELLSKHVRTKEYYYAIREEDPQEMDSVARAAWLIYLNKTCYNGIYRVNLKGRFNVPYGNRKAKIYDATNLRQISVLLKNVELLPQSYEKTLDRAEPRDFVYLDPPYHPLSKTASFTKYTKQPFAEDDQLNLAKEFERLTNLGCKVMLNNSYTDLITNLYGNYRIEVLAARRYINSDPNGRKAIKESLVLNYDNCNG